MAQETQSAANCPEPLTVPDGFEWYDLQIAGHHQSVVKNGKRQIGFLKNKSTGRILKPVQEGLLGSSELGFYNTVFVLRRPEKPNDDTPSTADDPILAELAPFIPIFYGTNVVPMGETGHLFMQLEDVTAKFHRPCVTDIKIGAQTHDPTASQEKIAYEKRKCPQAAQIGFRLLGMKVYDASTLRVISKDKAWGKTLQAEQIPSALEGFMVGRNRTYQLRVVESLLQRLHSIAAWFERQRRFHFYSSSLLLVYEGDEDAASSSSSDDQLCDVRMIDFTHVFDANTADTNYTYGLDNLIKQFEALGVKLRKN
uniref:Kinase n=1 Tax=Plectus sambesii TaxID=2011161 RepID=A0A914V8W9_9BILA